jgi:hypothetical protein
MIAADMLDKARSVRIEDELLRRRIKLRGKKGAHWGPCPICGAHHIHAFLRGCYPYAANEHHHAHNIRGDRQFSFGNRPLPDAFPDGRESLKSERALWDDRRRPAGTVFGS